MSAVCGARMDNARFEGPQRLCPGLESAYRNIDAIIVDLCEKTIVSENLAMSRDDQQLTTQLVLGRFFRLCIDRLHWFRANYLRRLETSCCVCVAGCRRSCILILSVVLAEGVAENRHDARRTCQRPPRRDEV